MKKIAKLRESDTGGRAKVKRVAILLSVVALMVVMMAMSVAPAFAAWTAQVVSVERAQAVLQLPVLTNLL